MKNDQYFFIIWFIVAGSILITLILKGRKSLKIFPTKNKNEFQFYEDYVSGYADTTELIKLGGARNALRIRVIDNQIWIYSNVLFAWIAEQYDLLHIIEAHDLLTFREENNEVIIRFVKSGSIKRIVLQSRKRNELLKSLAYLTKYRNNK